TAVSECCIVKQDVHCCYPLSDKKTVIHIIYFKYRVMQQPKERVAADNLWLIGIEKLLKGGWKGKIINTLKSALLKVRIG
ncbi:MAG TPA: hypothetical protein VNU93_01930, partial [Verrucomicrobiae bacterium]|nr:hypothetical protein [Verrucomicrobiae bacterium]